MSCHSGPVPVPLAPFPCGTLVLRAIGSAVIGRAAGQLACHAETDSPGGLDLAVLSIPAPRWGRAETRTRSLGSPTAVPAAACFVRVPGDGRDGSEARAGDTTMTATAGPCSSGALPGTRPEQGGGGGDGDEKT